MEMPMALFLSVLMFSLFSFVSVAVWADNRRREREAFHKSETLRKLCDAGEVGLTMMREQELIAIRRRHEGIKIGGIVNIAVGIGLSLLLIMLTGKPIFFVGLIPLLIGCSLLFYVFRMAPKD
jgi:hypothetical protein